MRKTLLLNNQKFHFDKTYLPTLIHGIEDSGASLFTMSVLADLYSQGTKVIALTGFSMAHEEFFKQTESHENTQFFTKENNNGFINLVLKTPNKNDQIILVKNIELFGEEVLNAVKDFNNLIISGDITKCSFKENLLEKSFQTKIYFSPLDEELLQLKKYQGYLKSQSVNGTISLEI